MRILIATDGSDYSNAAIDKACEMFTLENAAFRVVSVFENPAPIMAEPGLAATNYQEIADGLRELAASNAHQGEARVRKNLGGKVTEITSAVLNGFPDQEIIHDAAEWKADVIVVGSHGRGFWGRLLGSVSDGVVHHARCPVLVVRNDAPNERDSS